MKTHHRGVLTCAALGCEQSVLPDKLMCPAHWRRVPARQQADVYSAHKLLRNATPATVRDASRAYRTAREKAVKAVAP
jgi:hypothetical protein